MATVTKHRNSWVLGHTKNGKFVRRSLGKISEEQAKRILADFEAGDVPDQLKLTVQESFRVFRKSKERAAKRDIPYHLTLEQFRSMYESANGRCQLTGIPFSKYWPEGATKRPWFPSIDRIDSGGAYTPENCRIVCVAVNIALGEWGAEVLTSIAKAMVLGQMPARIEQIAKRR